LVCYIKGGKQNKSFGEGGPEEDILAFEGGSNASRKKIA
jgi:hypothetical protein